MVWSEFELVGHHLTVVSVKAEYFNKVYCIDM